MSSRPLQTYLLSVGQQFVVSPSTIQLIPTTCYILPEGSKEDKPSFAMILSTSSDGDELVVTQLSLRMFIESLSPEAKIFLAEQVVEMGLA